MVPVHRRAGLAFLPFASKTARSLGEGFTVLRLDVCLQLELDEQLAVVHIEGRIFGLSHFDDFALALLTVVLLAKLLDGVIDGLIEEVSDAAHGLAGLRVEQFSVFRQFHLGLVLTGRIELGVRLHDVRIDQLALGSDVTGVALAFCHFGFLSQLSRLRGQEVAKCPGVDALVHKTGLQIDRHRLVLLDENEEEF